MNTETEPTHTKSMEAARKEWIDVWQDVVAKHDATVHNLVKLDRRQIILAEILAWHVFLKVKGLV